MLDQFKAVSISWKNVSLDLREAISLNEQEVRTLLVKIKDILAPSDLLILSTCNRTEVYYTSNKDFSKDIIKLLCLEKGLTNPDTYLEIAESYNNPNEAVKHLFDVSIGLDAQVVGDMQISNQVKNAYQWSADEDLAGPFLHRLMHTIFFTNKRVVQETCFRDGAASVSYATVELIEELSIALADPKILIIGLGEMGRDVTVNLASTKLNNVTITNRTHSTSLELAAAHDFKAVPFEDLWDAIKEADIILSSVAAPQPVITKEKLSNLEILTYKYFIDISVPRSIEKEVESIQGALVYNIDHIQNKATEALEKRKAAIPQVESIIESGINDIQNWSQEMEVSPTIQKLKGALENIRQEEIARYVKNLDETEAQKVDQITKSITQKILKLPVLQLKAACKRGEAETLIDVLNDLFNLEKEQVKK